MYRTSRNFTTAPPRCSQKVAISLHLSFSCCAFRWLKPPIQGLPKYSVRRYNLAILRGYDGLNPSAHNRLILLKK